jgi:hypothetical protein
VSNVNVKLFPVLPTFAELGTTVIVPAPSLASVASVNVVVAVPEVAPVATTL